MLRTFNYTGRHRIKQDEASFEVNRHHAKPADFSADLRLDSENYPADASVYIDVWYKETRQRFSFGTVEQVQPPESTVLDEVESADGLQFRVLVVDESSRHALILGAGTFRAAGDDPDNEGRRGLVVVAARDLGALPWDLEFEEDGRPVLCINKNIPDPIGRMRTDPVFQALVFPAAIREMVRHILLSGEFDPDSEVVRQWLAFVLNFSDDEPGDLDAEAQERWLDDVVREFCRRFDLAERLANAFREDG